MRRPDYPCSGSKRRNRLVQPAASCSLRRSTRLRRGGVVFIIPNDLELDNDPEQTQNKPDREDYIMDFKNIIYTEQAGIATITINRPKVYNAFNCSTCEELIQAFGKAGWNRDIGVVVLTGAGDKAFCTGGDQTADAEDGGYGGRGTIGRR